MQEHLQSQDVAVTSIKIVSFAQLPPGTSATSQMVSAAPALAPAPAAGPSGVDMATVGKGVGAYLLWLRCLCPSTYA